MTFAKWLNEARHHFPSLNAANCRPSSPTDDSYNCIAWAAEDSERWWWPDPQEQNYWPPDVPRAPTTDSFVKAFETLGYSESSDRLTEPNKQKIAIFVSMNQVPTHAARQLLDGWWASKLGTQIDIEHELGAIEGPAYGTVAIILAKIALPSSPIGKAD